MSKLHDLREKFPIFTYEGYNWQFIEGKLEISFDYSLSETYRFHHRLILKDVSKDEFDALDSVFLEKMVFNIGLSEMFNYWKTTCSPTIQVKAGYLDDEQIAWWHHLLLHGMGEFFFVNDIDFSTNDFVTITSQGQRAKGIGHQKVNNELVPTMAHGLWPQKILVPVGGGKDSVVTIELLKQVPGLELTTFSINPTKASIDTSIASSISKHIAIDRFLDPLLYTMNDSDFLNGHVPISSVIAFVSTFVAAIKGIDAVPLSNEGSANEGNIEFHGMMINHQYSKTYEFEKRFQDYCKTYLNGQQSNKIPYYFSYLRPIYELQIGGIFAQYPQYHQVFRSCNRGQKTNTWCGDCPKCLFAYLILYPFMEHDYIVSLFGRDVFANENLKETALELIDMGKNKPLECVGMYEESLVAFYLSIKKLADQHIDLPVVLQLIKERAFLEEIHMDHRIAAIFNHWSQEHGIPDNLIAPLKQATQQIRQQVTGHSETVSISGASDLLRPEGVESDSKKAGLPVTNGKWQMANDPALRALESKVFVLLGLGREGLSTYRFLRQYLTDNKILLFDEKPEAELPPEWQAIISEDPNTEYKKLSSEDSNIKYQISNIVLFKSPGISPHSQFYQQVLSLFDKPEVTSNTNLFFELMKDKATIIGVTGTKGKSTTTAAIYHLLSTALGNRQKALGSSSPTPASQQLQRGEPTSYSLQPIYLGGNIGVPPLDLTPEILGNLETRKLEDTTDSTIQVSKFPSLQVVVLELSSHQLLTMKHSPNIAVIQEIVPEHLDYYETFEEYVQAKAQITKFQTSEDIVIFNSDYEIPTQIAKQSPGRLIDVSSGNPAFFESDSTPSGRSRSLAIPRDPFGTGNGTNYGTRDQLWPMPFGLSNGIISYNNEPVIDTKDLQIKGQHNILNILPAIAIAKIFDVSASDIGAALKSFKPLKHRLELVGQVNGVSYYNDSLATTPEACIAALHAFPQQDIVLIAGGYDRHLDFSALAEEILASKVRALVLFRPTGELIANEIGKRQKAVGSSNQNQEQMPPANSPLPIVFAETMQEAVTLASSFASSGDVVLMSPASASFGRFKDYADRGEQFRKAVEEL